MIKLSQNLNFTNIYQKSERFLVTIPSEKGSFEIILRRYKIQDNLYKLITVEFIKC